MTTKKVLPFLWEPLGKNLWDPEIFWGWEERHRYSAGLIPWDSAWASVALRFRSPPTPAPGMGSENFTIGILWGKAQHKELNVWFGGGGWVGPCVRLMPEAFPESSIQALELGFGNGVCLFPSMNSRTLRGSAAQCQGSMETRRWERNSGERGLARLQLPACGVWPGFSLWSQSAPGFLRGSLLGRAARENPGLF